MTDFTAIISGAGPAGLSAAVLLALDGVKTALIAPKFESDTRTTALMQPAMQMLKFTGLWTDELRSHCAPLKHLHLVDDTGNLFAAPRVEFTAREMRLDEFGWNVPLAALVPALIARATELDVTFIEGGSASAFATEQEITLKTEAGENYRAKVLLVADGAKSKLREALGFKVETERFDQMALATSFAHTVPHQFISTEFHKSAGPFTTVPLPGNFSSLVWMERPARMAELLALTDQQLATEIQLAIHGTLGKISNIGPRKAFPMQSQRASSFGANRALLIGEAAHALPPIGAQGLNLSLRDAALAADLIIGADDPGAETICSQYNALRRADVVPRQQMVAMLNRSLLSELLPFHLARAGGLAAIANFPPLRGLAMRQGLSPQTNLPFAMRG
jgi:2-octaprenyl-6-methoxyphenol hydroxylase